MVIASVADLELAYFGRVVPNVFEQPVGYTNVPYRPI